MPNLPREMSNLSEENIISFDDPPSDVDPTEAGLSTTVNMPRSPPYRSGTPPIPASSGLPTVPRLPSTTALSSTFLLSTPPGTATPSPLDQLVQDHKPVQATTTLSVDDDFDIWSLSSAISSSLNASPSSVTILANVLSSLFRLLSIKMLAPDYLIWKKDPMGSIAALSEAFWVNRPVQASKLALATTYTGSDLRQRVIDILTDIQGAESFHDAVLFALAVYTFLYHPESKNCDVVKAIILDYLSASDSLVPDLLLSTNKGAVLNLSQMEADALPGLSRLDPAINRRGFLKAWETLCQCVVNGLSFSPSLHPMDELAKLISDYSITSKQHALMAAEGETVLQVFARHKAALKSIHLLASSLDALHVFPSEANQGSNFRLAFVTRRSMHAAAQDLIRAGRFKLSATSAKFGISLHDMVSVFSEVEGQPSSYPGYEWRTDLPDMDPSLAVLPVCTSAAFQVQPKVMPSGVPSTHAYLEWPGGHIPSKADAARWPSSTTMDCSNCGNIFIVGRSQDPELELDRHGTSRCSLKRRDGVPWKAPHTPNGISATTQKALPPPASVNFGTLPASSPPPSATMHTMVAELDSDDEPEGPIPQRGAPSRPEPPRPTRKSGWLTAVTGSSGGSGSTCFMCVASDMPDHLRSIWAPSINEADMVNALVS